MHVAGHCVAALALGGTVYWLSVTGESPRFRILFPDANGEPPSEAAAVVYMAGPHAELRVGRHPTGVWRSSAEDKAEAARLLNSSAASLRAASLRAKELVQRHWQTVQLIASRLNTEGVLTGSEVIAAAETAPDGPPINFATAAASESEHRETALSLKLHAERRKPADAAICV